MNIDLPRDLANDVRTNNTFMLSKKELLIFKEMPISIRNECVLFYQYEFYPCFSSAVSKAQKKMKVCMYE